MRYLIVVMALLLSPLTSTQAQLSIQIGLPSVSIGFSQAHYPELVAVPGYPVYYDPNSDSNYFFYDGMYWVYEGDTWYASDWYNGPWSQVGPQYVPLFILRVPVGYYRRPPSYFHGWQANSAPRWGDHWGRDWERQRGGWDQWDRRAAPAPAPLPVYQKQYSGNRYPQRQEQRTLQTQNYRHEPREAAVKEIRRAQTPAPAARPDNRAAPRAQPAREAPRAQPTREAPRSEPAREAPRAQPAREAPRGQAQDREKGRD